MFFDDKNRQVVPRLRPFDVTAAIGELGRADAGSAKELSEGDRLALAASRRDWEEDRTIWTASDLITTAFVLGREADDSALGYLLGAAYGCPAALRAFASRLRGNNGNFSRGVEDPTDVTNLKVRVGLYRRRLRGEPRNTLLWVELARLYLLLGQHRSALRAVTVAASTPSSSRFIVRSASRIFLHLREGERAIRLLRDSPISRSDPWVISAEIATSLALGVPSLRAWAGRAKCEDASFSEFDRSELASALGTVEMANGKMRQARRFFRASLCDPNENTVAQAAWASREVGDVGVSAVSERQIPMLFEAPARASARAGDWLSAIEHGTRWLKDQYFSKTPAIFLSYVAALAEDYDFSARVIRKSLEVNPGDPILTNNLCFALCRLGRTHEASEIMSGLSSVDQPVQNRTAQTATRGLIGFRMGDIASGRRLYNEAIELARSGARDSRLHALARLNLAREEINARTPIAAATAVKVLGELPKNPSPDVKQVAEQLEQDLRLLEAGAPSAGGAPPREG